MHHRCTGQAPARPRGFVDGESSLQDFRISGLDEASDDVSYTKRSSTATPRSRAGGGGGGDERDDQESRHARTMPTHMANRGGTRESGWGPDKHVYRLRLGTPSTSFPISSSLRRVSRRPRTSPDFTRRSCSFTRTRRIRRRCPRIANPPVRGPRPWTNRVARHRSRPSSEPSRRTRELAATTRAAQFHRRSRGRGLPLPATPCRRTASPTARLPSCGRSCARRS